MGKPVQKLLTATGEVSIVEYRSIYAIGNPRCRHRMIYFNISPSIKIFSETTKLS
jgi:hypothetical protein